MKLKIVLQQPMAGHLVILSVLLCIFSINVHASDIAICSNLKGISYFPNNKNISKNGSGWGDDGIKGGIVKLQKDVNGEFNILIVDSSRNIISSTDEGGKIEVLNKSSDQISLTVYYPGQTIEVYTFLTNKEGKELIYTINRGGETAVTTKASIYVGECDYIYHNLVD